MSTRAKWRTYPDKRVRRCPVQLRLFEVETPGGVFLVVGRCRLGRGHAGPCDFAR